MPDYEFNERVAIKMDSGIPEHLAIKQAKQEADQPECLQRFAKLREQRKVIEAEKKAKHSTRYSYDE